MRRTVALLSAVVLLTGCSAGHASARTPSLSPSVSADASTTPATPDPPATPSAPASAPGQTARLVWSMQGSGSAVLRPTLVGRPKAVTLRMTCRGTGKPALRSSGGGLLMATDGCQAGVVYGATFAVTARHDPAVIELTATGEVTWFVQLWQGRYVERPAPPASA